MTSLIPSPSIQVVNGVPTVSSLTVAEHFEKPHKNVLRSIEALASECAAEFNRLNFEPTSYADGQGREQPMYLLTRDGFSLVVMGFTGKKALQWKVRYIEAFNAMEQAITAPKAIPALSTADDRKPLRALVHAWSLASGIHHAALWPQVKAHFQLSRIDDLPEEWLTDALAFVQNKIDSLQKALPVSKPKKVIYHQMLLDLDKLDDEIHDKIAEMREWTHSITRRIGFITGPLFLDVLDKLDHTKSVCTDPAVDLFHRAGSCVQQGITDALEDLSTYVRAGKSYSKLLSR